MLHEMIFNATLLCEKLTRVTLQWIYCNWQRCKNLMSVQIKVVQSSFENRLQTPCYTYVSREILWGWSRVKVSLLKPPPPPSHRFRRRRYNLERLASDFLGPKYWIVPSFLFQQNYWKLTLNTRYSRTSRAWQQIYITILFTLNLLLFTKPVKLPGAPLSTIVERKPACGTLCITKCSQLQHCCFNLIQVDYLQISKCYIFKK